MAGIHDLAKAIAASPDGFPILYFSGVVQSVDGNLPWRSLTITLGGSSVPIPGVRYLESYAPSGQDTVDILKIGEYDYLVIGTKAI
jgi:hypothetical protein